MREFPGTCIVETQLWRRKLWLIRKGRKLSLTKGPHYKIETHCYNFKATSQHYIEDLFYHCVVLMFCTVPVVKTMWMGASMWQSGRPAVGPLLLLLGAAVPFTALLLVLQCVLSCRAFVASCSINKGPKTSINIHSLSKASGSTEFPPYVVKFPSKSLCSRIPVECVDIGPISHIFLSSLPLKGNH